MDKIYIYGGVGGLAIGGFLYYRHKTAMAADATATDPYTDGAGFSANDRVALAPRPIAGGSYGWAPSSPCPSDQTYDSSTGACKDIILTSGDPVVTTDPVTPDTSDTNTASPGSTAPASTPSGSVATPSPVMVRSPIVAQPTPPAPVGGTHTLQSTGPAPGSVNTSASPLVMQRSPIVPQFTQAQWAQIFRATGFNPYTGQHSQ